jgi:1,4-alpha-glucan branching enzyme
VQFVVPLSAGRRAAVAGDFNGWSPQAHIMHRDTRRGVFCTCVPLTPGRRQYRLVIDGRWSQDPHNEHSELNPFGERNSVVEVKPLPRRGAMSIDAPHAAD